MLARKSVLIVATNLVGALSGLASLYFIGHYVLPDEVGTLTYALSIAGMFAFVAGLGFDAAHQKRVSEGVAFGDALATYTRVKLVLGAVFAVGLLLVAFAWDRVRGFQDTSLALVAVAVLYYLLTQLRFIPIATFNARLETAKTQIMNLVEQLTKMPLIALASVLVALHNGRALEPLVRAVRPLLAPFESPVFLDRQAIGLLLGIAQSAAVAASLAVGVWLLHRHGYPQGRYDRALARSYRVYAIPIAVFSALYYIATQIDTFMVGFFWTPSDVGIYFAAQRLVSLVFVLPMAVGTIVFPRISSLAAAGDTPAVARLARESQRLLSLVTVLASMFLIVYARQGVRTLVGAGYLGAAPVLVFLALYSLFFSLATVPSNVVSGYDKPRWVAWAGITMVVVNIVLNLWFIPSSILGVPLLGLSAFGASITTAIAQFLSLVLLVVMTKRLIGVQLLGGPVLKQLLAAALVGTALFMAQRWPLFDATRAWELPVLGLVGTALYVAVLAALGEARRSDLALFRDLVHPGRMAQYITGELRRPER